jgi:hypothetical protein
MLCVIGHNAEGNTTWSALQTSCPVALVRSSSALCLLPPSPPQHNRASLFDRYPLPVAMWGIRDYLELFILFCLSTTSIFHLLKYIYGRLIVSVGGQGRHAFRVRVPIRQGEVTHIQYTPALPPQATRSSVVPTILRNLGDEFECVSIGILHSKRANFY